MHYPRKKLREVTLQLLYSHDMGGREEENREEAERLLIEQVAAPRAALREADTKVNSILHHLHEIDEMISQAAEGYLFERIQRVERNVLRLAIYELFFDDEIPEKVAIAEAIRLSRKFSTPESANFVNAILDRLWKERQVEEEEDKEEFFFRNGEKEGRRLPGG